MFLCYVFFWGVGGWIFGFHGCFLCCACVHVLISILSFSVFFESRPVCVCSSNCLPLAQFLFLFSVCISLSLSSLTAHPQFFPFAFRFFVFISCDIKLKCIAWFVKVTLNVHECSHFFFKSLLHGFPFIYVLHDHCILREWLPMWIQKASYLWFGS